MLKLRYGAVLLLCISGFAQIGFKLPTRDTSPLVEPAGAVRRFCQMDAEGFRLSSETGPRLQTLTTWKQLPPWTAFEIISTFQLGTARSSARGVVVPVTFNVIGRYETLAGYSRDVRTRNLEVLAVEQDGVWKVTGTEDLALPRISRLRAYRWLRDQAAREADPATRANLERAVQELQP